MTHWYNLSVGGNGVLQISDFNISMATPDPRTVEAVQDILEYHFSDSSILHNALQITHPILSNETLPDEPDSRLAYLGDRVVHLAIADHWHRTPLSIGMCALPLGFDGRE